MSQAEPSAPLDPEPGRRTTSTVRADGPSTGSGDLRSSSSATSSRTVVVASTATTSPTGAGADTLDAPVTTGHGASRDPAHRQFWGEDDVSQVRPNGRSGRRRRGRRARREQWVVRNVSTWSALKVSVLFFACMWAVILVAGMVLWNAGDQAGLIGNAESFWAEATGSDEVAWDGEVVFRAAAMATAVLAVACVAFAVLFSVLFNLICDMTGGIRFTVLAVEPRQGTRPAGGDAGSTQSSQRRRGR